jgi:hypothetical protein
MKNMSPAQTSIIRILGKCVLMRVQDETVQSMRFIHLPFTMQLTPIGNFRETMAHARQEKRRCLPAYLGFT